MGKTSSVSERAQQAFRRFMQVDGFDVVIDLKNSSRLWIRDARSGRQYLDFFSFVTSNPLGMNPAAFQEPEFREKLFYAACHKVSNSDIATPELMDFVETFSRIARPDFMAHLFFIEGGTQGVENSLKAAFDWKVRKNFAAGSREEKGQQVIHFRQAFHGRSGYCLSITNTIDPAKTQYFPKFNWPRIDNPKILFPLNGENLAEVERAESESIRQMEGAFAGNPGDIAAIIIEPIQGEGGDNHFRPEFFQSLRRLADEQEAMLILDEVQTGLGMTGKMWAYEHTGIRPDMIAFGKKAQVCGFMCSARVDQVARNVFAVPSRINSTWGGNLADMVRSQRILETIEKENLVENAARMGAYLHDSLCSLQCDYPVLIRNCRGRGLMQAFDFPDPDFRRRFLEDIGERGLLILPCGSCSVRFRPPLIVDSSEIDTAMGMVRQSLRTVSGGRS